SIDCQLRSTILNKKQYVETNALLKKVYGTNEYITDFVAKKVIGGKYGPRDISIDEMRKRIAFPAFASLEGQMIQRLCFTKDNDWTQRKKKTVAIFQSILKCSPEKTGNIALLCRNDDKTTQDIFNTIFRMNQIESLCKVPTDVLDAILNNYLITISNSKRGEVMPLLGLFNRELSEDLSRAVNDEKCSYIAMASEEAAINAEERESTEKFKACIVKTVSRLDDQISPADVIATAVYGVCLNQLAGRYTQSEEFERGFKPGLIAIVLEHRAKMQNAEKK
ncbi:MAG: hypothetical protein WAT68_10840, partial [Candidatus Nitrotoga sp.]